mmetsp:Transcript_16131/g.34091  ORF Transcript_16131/g.34091 Transcript_16131/m.34091 type:complete len:384 (-) Transcript_16131:285-1436(-)
MKSIIALSFALLVGFTQAACPNSCSGHGTCGVDEVCTCYPGWGTGGNAGGDCSERFCPYELAWVDNPTRNGGRHRYAECANKGTCDRDDGECQCFSGYEGKACGRQSCPNDCSGHGTCEYMKDLAFGIVYNEYYDGSSNALSGVGVGGKSFQGYSWDEDRARSCVCDAGWLGLSCGERMCPYGNDVMDVIPGFDETSLVGMPGYGNEYAQVQTVTLYDADLDNTRFFTKTFAIQFTSKLNETYVTQPIMWDSDDDVMAGYIESALKKLPNKVIDDVDVDVDSDTDADGAIIHVTFTGSAVQGKQHKLEILQDTCEEGCTPRISGLTNIRTFSATTLSTVEISTLGDHNSFECGRRGTCDRKSGICNCFTGFTGDTCSILTALV